MGNAEQTIVMKGPVANMLCSERCASPKTETRVFTVRLSAPRSAALARAAAEVMTIQDSDSSKLSSVTRAPRPSQASATTAAAKLHTTAPTATAEAQILARAELPPPPLPARVSLDSAALENLSPEEVVALTHAACVAHLEEHLQAHLQQTPNCSYEEWIAVLHPENACATGIDERFYVEQSQHLKLWNRTVDMLHQVAPHHNGVDLTPHDGSGSELGLQVANSPRRSITGLNIRRKLADAWSPSKTGHSYTGFYIREHIAEVVSPTTVDQRSEHNAEAFRPMIVDQLSERSAVDEMLIGIDRVWDSLAGLGAPAACA